MSHLSKAVIWENSGFKKIYGADVRKDSLQWRPGSGTDQSQAGICKTFRRANIPGSARSNEINKHTRCYSSLPGRPNRNEKPQELKAISVGRTFQFECELLLLCSGVQVYLGRLLMTMADFGVVTINDLASTHMFQHGISTQTSSTQGLESQQRPLPI